MRPLVKVNVTLTDQGLADFHSVANELANHGLKISHRSENLGIVSGEIDAAKLVELQSVSGVDNVGEDEEMHTMS